MINVYVLECSDGSLYTGWTNDLEKRLAAHNAGTASKCTRARRPVKLVYSETVESKGEALKREVAIKKLTREQKLSLIDRPVILDGVGQVLASKAAVDCIAAKAAQDTYQLFDFASRVSGSKQSNIAIAGSSVKTENILSSSEKMVFSSSRTDPNLSLAGRKILLTGEPGVGKSTIINKVVSAIGVKPKGFNTLARPVIPDGAVQALASSARQSTAKYNEGIYIVPFGDTPLRGMPPNEPRESGDIPRRGVSPYFATPVGLRNRSERKVTAFPEVFDTLGVKILTDSQDADLIIMDELGFMESEALLFQQKVLQILNSDATVLGVIKPKHTPFLDSIRALSNIEIIKVTEKNRDLIFEQLRKMLFQ